MDFNCNINTGEFGEFLTQNVLNIFYISGSDNFKVNHGCIKMRCFFKKKIYLKGKIIMNCYYLFTISIRRALQGPVC